MKKIIGFLLVTVLSASVQAVTPTAYSDQQTLLNAGNMVAQSDAGEVVTKYFSYTTTAISNKTVALVEIPANTRIIGGQIAISAMGGAETFDVGLIAKDAGGYINKPTTTADDVDLFLDGISCSNAVVDTFATISAGDSNAAYAGYDTPVYLTITAPAGGAVWVADKAVTGFVQYIK